MFHVKHSVSEYIVPRETLNQVREIFGNRESQFSRFADELLFWNKKINLVSRDIEKETLLKHIEHSLCIMYAPGWANSGLRIVDAGSGGGLPGVPLAIASDNNYVLIDLVAKKMLAVGQMIKSLKLDNSKAVQEDLQDTTLNEKDIVISKHAFKLYDFLKLTSHKRYNQAIFLKGEDFQEELDLCDVGLKVMYIPLEKYHSDQFYKGKYVVILNNEKSGAST
jgi:16S rRNA (guanine527-N7)-methyltransferase